MTTAGSTSNGRSSSSAERSGRSPRPRWPPPARTWRGWRATTRPRWARSRRSAVQRGTGRGCCRGARCSLGHSSMRGASRTPRPSVVTCWRPLPASARPPSISLSTRSGSSPRRKVTPKLLGRASRRRWRTRRRPPSSTEWSSSTTAGSWRTRATRRARPGCGDPTCGSQRSALFRWRPERGSCSAASPDQRRRSRHRSSHRCRPPRRPWPVSCRPGLRTERSPSRSCSACARSRPTWLRVYRKLGVRSRTQMVARLAALRAEVT